MKVVNPSAAVIVWNYLDRMIDGEADIFSHQLESSPLVLSTEALISIRTSKSKSSPAGDFELVLAPNNNWLSKITAGSWICILMGQTPISPIELPSIGGLAKGSPSHIKFLGLIESVRMVTATNENGARQTLFTVNGKDWGSVFDAVVYVDPVARDVWTGPYAPIGSAAVFAYGEELEKSAQKTSTDNVNAILSFWGKSTSTFFGADLPVNVKPLANFRLPPEVSAYIGLLDNTNLPTNGNISDLITVIGGVLSSEDSDISQYQRCYKDVKESIGAIRPDSLMGQHTVWQLLLDNCNDVINELVCDLRFEGPTSRLALYKRVRPFVIDTTGVRNPELHALAKDLISPYKNVRTALLSPEDIISVNAGTNARDKVNFAEIVYDLNFILSEKSNNLNAINKLNAQIPGPLEGDAWSREGFRPLILTSKYVPCNSNGVEDVQSLPNWKYLLKEWYFNTHNMLNGTITFIGQDQYIQVGDNIMFPTSVLAPKYYINVPDKYLRTMGEESYIIAHVESVSHEFDVSSIGGRTFKTSISFVRGVIASKSKEIPAFFIGDSGLDSGSEDLSDSDISSGNAVSTRSNRGMF